MDQVTKLKDDTGSAEEPDIRDRLLGDIARDRLTAEPPAQIGTNYFYEVADGWEVAIFQMDRHVRRANSISHFKSLMDDDSIRTIFIPQEADIAKETVIETGSRVGHRKSIFFEVK